MSGQTLADRLTAAKYSIAGQGLAKSVCKATTEEVIGPKKKHLDYLLACTNEPNVSIPQMANLLIERTTNASWVVVFKALITVHHLMCYGNERFTQYLASSNCAFQLSNFLDKTGTAGIAGPNMSYDMSTYIRRYAKYLNEKALSYRTVAFDFCKVKRGKEDGTLRTMPTDKLLKTLPVLQNQLDALLEFDCAASELTNGVINTAFMLLFRDLIRIFACYNDGIIHLLEEYFEMNKKQARDALDLYKRFLIRMDKVSEFLKTAESVGVDRSDIPDLSKAPSSLLDALESHLASLEGRKYVPQANGAGMNGTSGGLDEESAKLKALADEEAALAAIKEKHEAKQTNPFLASPTTETAPAMHMASAQHPPSSGNDILDLLEAPAPPPQAAAGSKPSDDLLQLGGNPFADIVGSSTSVSHSGAAPMGMAMGGGGLGIFGDAPSTGPNSMVNPDWIWNTPTGGFDAFGQMLQPVAVGAAANSGPGFGGAPGQGQVPAGMAPGSGAGKPGQQQNKSLFSGDLDSTLASLADSLSVGPAGASKGWNSPAKQAPKPMGIGAGMMGQPMASANPGFPMNSMGMGFGAAPPANMAARPAQPGAFLAGGSSDPFGGL